MMINYYDDFVNFMNAKYANIKFKFITYEKSFFHIFSQFLKKYECPQIFTDNCIKNYLRKLFTTKRVVQTVNKKKTS